MIINNNYNLNDAFNIVSLKQTENYKIATEILSLEAKKKNKKAIHYLGLLELNQQSNEHKEHALNYFTLGSILGYEESSFMLGKIFYEENNFYQARFYLLRCKHLGKSFYFLGKMEEKGWNGKISYHRAFEYFLAGANLNDSQCIYQCAYYYYKGLGIKKNEDKSKHLLATIRNRKIVDSFNLLNKPYSNNL